MPNRIYFNNSIAELEDLFEGSGDNKKLCQDLLHELSFRSTARSQRLAGLIEQTICGDQSEPTVERNEAIEPVVNTLPELPMGPEVVTPGLKLGPKPPITNETENILRAWTALEVLSPQGFRRETDLTSGDRNRIARLDNDALPWERGEIPPPRKRLFYELILGTMELGPAVKKLLKLYSDNRPDEPRTSNKVPLASVLLDKEGRPLEEDTSFAISSFAWGVPIALKGNLKFLAQWPAQERGLLKAMRERLIRRDDNGDVIPLTKASINSLYSFLVQRLELQGHDTTPPYFAVRRYEFFASKIPPEPSLLNSFYLEDLEQARSLAKASELPKALKFYLGESALSDRTDLIEDDEGLRAVLQPASTPLGRWPGPGRFPLAPLQQAAVNATNNGMEATNIVAVNGPPGTGKTTLLRDIVAARVVGRAAVMCEYDDPSRAFHATNQSVQRQGARVTLHKIDDRLKGFEMVVASSNNKAVENVSAELPAFEAIASDATELRYFRSISDNVLDRKTWGATAAVLGNASNRYQFAQKFWRDEERGLSTYLNHIAGVPQYASEPQEDGPSITRLREVIVHEAPPSNRTEAKANWESARKSFQDALSQAQKTCDRLQRVHEAIVKVGQLATEIGDIQQHIISAESSIDELNQAQAALVSNLDVEEAKLQALQDELRAHMAIKPGFIARLFRTKVARVWKAHEQRLLGQHRDSAGRKKAAQEVLERLAAELARQQNEYAQLQERVKRLKAEQQRLQEQISDVCSSINAPVPDTSFFDEGHEAKQVAHLWFDKAACLERDQVFETAIAVHRAFVDCSAEKIRQNLAIFMESFGTRSLGTHQKDQLIPDLWTSFFLVVPVVSTTFASVHRMFSRLKPETLGWLLVDEAGQALPQAAVGAIMRSKRAVVVGDPLQIEPIVTLPNTLTEEICAYFGVKARTYNAPEASVQTLADAASPYCARFPIGSGHRDVGSPLLVHRRCDSPMFEISNEIAYSNLMVQAKAPNRDALPLGASCWIDVVGTPGPDKWCAEEGDKLIELLQTLRNSGTSADVYVVTPFVIVQDNLREELKRSGVLDGWVGAPYRWTYEHVGTVHTVQGREAATVFLVLGAQGTSQNGARAWAGGRPNLVNVAVTRAKSSLYVIGNRQLWREVGVFKTLDRYLPEYRQGEIGDLQVYQ